MTVIIDLPPGMEARLHEEARKAGEEASVYIARTLEERLRPLPPRLSPEEARLLQQINQGWPAGFWQRYNELIAKRRAEELTFDEHAELIACSDQIEEANARRVQHLVELAHLRRTTLTSLMEELGIKPLSYA